jgi:putative ABC transport system permease protein
MKAIVSEHIVYVYQDDDRHSGAAGKAEDIDEEVEFLFPQLADSGQEIISQHRIQDLETNAFASIAPVYNPQKVVCGEYVNKGLFADGINVFACGHKDQWFEVIGAVCKIRNSTLKHVSDLVFIRESIRHACHGLIILLKRSNYCLTQEFPYDEDLKLTAMLRNYFVIALRLLVKNKLFSLINIIGLSTGIACCILITMYIQDEFKYEKGFPERQKVFRINTTFIKDGVTEYGAYTSPAIPFGLKEALPGIEQTTRVVKFLGVDQHLVRYKDKTFFEKRAFLVDSTFLEVFPYQLKEGDASTALDAPSSALISGELSERIFGDRSPLDEFLIINSGQSVDTFRITGVVATPRYPSHIDADLYLSMNSNGLGSWILAQTTWSNNNLIGSYLKLQDPQQYKTLEAKFAEQIQIHAGEELKASGRHKELSLQPLDDIRLYSDFIKGSSADMGSSMTYVYIIGTIGAFILLLACINFMNLTTARSAQRASEVGIRKSMGAFRGNLIRQFLGESMIIVFLALLVSFAIVILVLPLFNTVMQKELTLSGNNLPFIIISTILICLFTGGLAGSYPAFFLSSLRPTQVLKGKSLTGDGSQWLRKGLVVFQFVITISCILFNRSR